MYFGRGSTARRKGLINARDMVRRDRNVKYYFNWDEDKQGSIDGMNKKKKFF